jgi:hypothetical protein
MALLPAEALHLGDRDSRHTDFVQRVLHIVQLERLDDGFDLLHVTISLRVALSIIGTTEGKVPQADAAAR